MPKIVDREAHRSELLRHSFEVVAQVGYGSLSMKALAGALGVSLGQFYHYFDSKEDWFVSLVAHYASDTFAQLGREIPHEATLPEKTALLAGHIARNGERYANMVRVAGDYFRMPGVGAQGGLLQLGLSVSQLYDYIGTLFETDEATARALVSYVVGAVSAARVDPRATAVDECLPVIRKLLDVGISRGKGATS